MKKGKLSQGYYSGAGRHHPKPARGVLHWGVRGGKHLKGIYKWYPAKQKKK
jgi:hypothetical protein